ncbi:MAG: hypothetical protein JRI97_03385 [Deltaproteobacteria bacterium]|nr:hypothetical protein [Deltaproteobacteria bacterium]
MATVFPRYKLVVTGPGIHASQVVRAAEYVAREHPGEDADRVVADAVALYLQPPNVLVRSDPSDMDRVFAADELIQRLVPRTDIRFTGLHFSSVRRALRRRGESWRIAPPPLTPEAAAAHIRSCRLSVDTPTVYYYNPDTGEHVLTFQQFENIGPLLSSDPDQALARLREICRLASMTNAQGYKELSFLTAPDREADPEAIRSLARAVERSAPDPGETARAYDVVRQAFLRAAGPELAVDDPDLPAWRLALIDRLTSVRAYCLEESILGLSPEFHLNIRWLPGARILEDRAVFDPQASPRARSLITHFLETMPGARSVNLGRVVHSQSRRDTSGEEREVLVAAVEPASGPPEVFILREAKWNVEHRMKLGFPVEAAVEATSRYRDYIADRLAAMAALGAPIPEFSRIEFMEPGPCGRPVPVYYFSRPYVPGMATDKIAPALYRLPGFTPALARLLGVSAALSMALGRADPRTGSLFFDDGDEVVARDERGLPRTLLLADTTGSFYDVATPLADLLPQVARRMARHLAEAAEHGAPTREIVEAAAAFGEGLAGEIRRLKALVENDGPGLTNLFAGRTPEPGGIRRRWEAVLFRIRQANPEELGRLARETTLGEPGLSAENREPVSQEGMG